MPKGVIDQFFETGFTIYRFKRSLSWRDFATPITLAFLLVAVQETLLYYEAATWYFIVGPFFLLALFNHVFYFAEHGRPNNFIGRTLQGVFFAFCYLILWKVYHQISYGGEVFDTENLFLAPIALFIVMMIFECFVGVLKRVLMLFRWQIL